ncbi:MAG: hypothetical protein AB7P99_10655, partial [Vicinamibacterales bacterium]
AALWQQRLAGGFERVELAYRLDAAAARLRPAAIEWIDGLSRQHADSPVWWLAQLSERNTQVSPFFLHVCYLAVALDLFEARNAEPPRLIVAEDWGLLEALRRLLERRGHHVILDNTGRRRSRAASHLRILARPLHFLGAEALPWMAAAVWNRAVSRGRSAPAAGRSVLLKTFLVRSSLAEDGTFQDSYLPALHEFLQTHGFDVWVVPVVADTEPGPLALAARMYRSSTRFIVPTDWLRLRDYLAAVVDGIRTAWLPRTVPPLAGLDVEPLVAEERRRQAGASAPIKAGLLGRLPARLAEKGFRPEQVIAWSENQSHDKAFVRGCRAAFPEARYTAVQNTQLPPNLLNLFPTAVECESGVVGDLQVCSGPLPSAILQSASRGRLRTVVACGLRYAYLHESRRPDTRRDADGNLAVLVLLPVSPARALEVLDLIAPLVTTCAWTRWRVKAHPALPLPELQRRYPAKWPEGLAPIDGLTADWIRRSSCVVTMASGSALEATALSVPVIRLASRTTLNFDTLAWHADSGAPCFTTAELAAALDAVSNFGAADHQRLRLLGDDVRQGWFAPVTEQNLAKFVA